MEKTKTNKWHSVSDVMPPKDRKILVKKRTSENKTIVMGVTVLDFATQEDLINYGITKWRNKEND